MALFLLLNFNFVRMFLQHLSIFYEQENVSEDYGSSDSTSGYQENENGSSPSHKSPASGEKSPGQSSLSSSTHADDEGGSPCSTQGEGSVSIDRTSSSTPEHFERVCTDRESTCARTDLVYVHTPAPVKQLESSATKVRDLYGMFSF